MKKFIMKYSVYILLAVMIAILIPGISKRIDSESKNNNITIAFLYNDIANKLTDAEVSKNLAEYKKNGINVVAFMEEDMNSLVSRGDVTCIKYNVLRHKYDQESLEIADLIKEKCPDVSYDNYIVLAEREEWKEFLNDKLPKRYSDKDYKYVGNFNNLDLYVLFEGRKDLWDITLGYNEKKIKEVSKMGFDISLIHRVKNYSKQEYIEDIERIVKEYDVEYFNIKADSSKYTNNKIIKENYKGIANIINKNNMTLVVTENMDQLSNQKCIGYDYIFNETLKGSKKIVRSYETYDDFQADGTNYKYRTEQFFNSTIDRNIRFIVVTQIGVEKLSFGECADKTLEAAKLYKSKIEKEGFTVNKQQPTIDYTVNKSLNYAVCAVIMILCLLLMFEMISGKKYFWLTVSGLVLSGLGFVVSYFLPASILSLYPSVFCVVQSCFAMTAVLYLMKTKKDKWNLVLLIISSIATMIFTLFVGAICMGTLLSGIEYYMNNEIFRGIKLSLLVPVFYTAILFYFMFVKGEQHKIWEDIKKVLFADIKVYWIIIGGCIAFVGLYYITRSGNVNQISGIEQIMRSKLTDIFQARPRTKEFLVGYPSLVLFVYYMKNSECQLIKWLLAVGTAILAASVTNSFCHVFTDFTVITMRTVNGLLVGAIVSVIAYIANLILIKLLKVLKDKLFQNTEMR